MGVKTRKGTKKVTLVAAHDLGLDDTSNGRDSNYWQSTVLRIFFLISGVGL
jgi:hypothetical protein